MRVKIFISILYKLYREKIDTRDIMRLCAFLIADYSLCYTKAIIGFFLYFLIGKLCKCRSPPFINLLEKFKLIGGKKDGRTPKKKKI